MRIAALLAVAALLLVSILVIPGPEVAGAGPLTLTVGDPDQMKSRNVLRVQIGPYHTDDVTVGILAPVYSSLVIRHYVTDALQAYIAKGVDADASGTFDPDEYSVFGKEAGTNASDITAYLDFNGVRWHDGVQMTVMDLLSTLVIESLSPTYGPDLRVLWDRAGAPTSNFTWNRWLAVDIAPKSWAGEASLAGDAALRVAVRFRLQAPFPRFYEAVLGSIPLLPRHVWELTGDARHVDFGRAVYPEADPRAGRPVPVNETLYVPFDYTAAASWSPSDADVIGAGPFRFTTWVLGSYAQLDRNDAYYVGTDPVNPAVVFDARLPGLLHRPFVERIVFRVYRTAQLGVLAIRNGEIQYYRANVLPEYIPDLLSVPQVRVWANAGLGFTYLAYNLRRVPFGYAWYPPADSVADDTGLPLRLAFAHLIDKPTITRVRLFNFAIVADGGPVSPANTRWTNDTLVPLRYDLTEAARILDVAGWTDPPGPCMGNGTGCRSLPDIGTRQISILTPSADVEPIAASVGAAIASAARSVGLNLLSMPTAQDALLQALAARAFDLYIGDWQIRDTDPDFLYALFHCANAPAGLNYPGYCDSKFDSIIGRSREEMDLAQRGHLIKWAQGVLMGDRPLEPLYFPTVLQATWEPAFVNWTVQTGYLWNYWSLIGIRPIDLPQPLRITARYNSSMTSEGQQLIQAMVRDRDGNGVAGAAVTFQITSADGGRFVENSGTTITGTTDINGIFDATYRAPRVLAEPRGIAIEVSARHDLSPTPVRVGIWICVFPPLTQFLALRVSLPAGDIGLPESPLIVRIDVWDESGNPAADAIVSATVSPPNGTISRQNGSAAEMASLLFFPPPDLRATQWYRLSLVATKSGSYPGYANVSLLIFHQEPVDQPPPQFPHGRDVHWIAGGIFAAIVAASAFAWMAIRVRRRETG